ncbi:TPA: hypothetical protein ACGIKW_003311 [Acinetobacter baumannii]|uniref:hypothetical protein n=1 Tax=Acinetobacter baumannii TaxID=470 RepID=UPI0029574E0F|nr:hypothetical protein [Acinetobacter baumannii]
MTQRTNQEILEMLDEIPVDLLIASIVKRVGSFTISQNDLNQLSLPSSFDQYVDLKTIRYKNVRHLINEIGSIRKFADKIGKSQNQVGQFAGSNPVKSIGDSIAKQIENSLNLSEGWLSQKHPLIAYQ